MKKILCSLALLHFGVQATPFSDNVLNDIYNGQPNGIPTANDHNDGVPDLFDAANLLLGTSYTSNADLDSRFIANDQVFVGQGQHNIALIGLTAGNYNTLGVYTDLGQGQNKQVLLPSDPQFGFTGDGSAANPSKARPSTSSVNLLGIWNRAAPTTTPPSIRKTSSMTVGII
ncbi:hypothetical protein [Agarivorans gilvus]|uniref:hypothetical protein n=1 Tax=Agarivorans gilvus TaxID=680279 RepID=UPI0006EBEA24|nr:hypothetical protein [Agarivorans gilvus]